MNDISSLIQRQLEAYNAKDVGKWLSAYAKDARQLNLHGECIAAGHDEMRERIVARFEEPDLHARLLSRTIMQSIVVDYEIVTRNFTEGKGEVEMLCVYEVQNGLIQTASFALGLPNLYGGKNA
ncbi:steroid delta-isomerase [Halomonas litopenaei]|nr:steroid delta-isomerase [Halomonas litopenaei]